MSSTNVAFSKEYGISIFDHINFITLNINCIFFENNLAYINEEQLDFFSNKLNQ